MKSFKQRVLSLSSFIGLLFVLSSCGGPSICDCVDKVKNNPLDVSKQDIEDCKEAYGNLSGREAMKKYQEECK